MIPDCPQTIGVDPGQTPAPELQTYHWHRDRLKRQWRCIATGPMASEWLSPCRNWTIRREFSALTFRMTYYLYRLHDPNADHYGGTMLAQVAHLRELPAALVDAAFAGKLAALN